MVIPFRDKFKIRQLIRNKQLLLPLMLKQGQTWYPLLNTPNIMEDMVGTGPESIEMQELA